MKGIHLKHNTDEWSSSFDYAMFTGKDVNPSKRLCTQNIWESELKTMYVLCISSAHCVLIKGSINCLTPAPDFPQWILSQFCAAVLFPWCFFLNASNSVLTWAAAGGHNWFNTASCGRDCKSRDTVNTCSTVQSRCCSECSLSISPEPLWMPVLSCSHTGEFNSYPGNVVNQLEVLIPWGYSH